MIKSIPSCISVSSKGEQFLSSARPDYQPPLVLPVSSEMVEDDEHKSKSSEVEEYKSLATCDCEGFSEVGNKCYIVVHYLIFISFVIFLFMVEIITNK